MSQLLERVVASLSTLINIGVALTVLVGVLDSLWGLRKGLTEARCKITDSLLTGLSMFGAGTLLNTLHSRTWEQLGFLLVVFTLRSVLKQAIQRERRYISGSP